MVIHNPWFCQNLQTPYLRKSWFGSLVAFTYKTVGCCYLAICTIETPRGMINLAVTFTSQNWNVIPDLPCYIDSSLQLFKQLPGLFNCIIDMRNYPWRKEYKLSYSRTCIQGSLNSKKLHRELSEVHCRWVFWKIAKWQQVNAGQNTTQRKVFETEFAKQWRQVGRGN